MRAPLVLRGFSTPRIPQCGPRIPQFTGWATRAGIRSSSSSSADKEQQQQGSAGSGSNSSHNSTSWTPTRTLLASAFAAGLGYSYASYYLAPKTSTKPRYGSMKDCEKVHLSITIKSDNAKLTIAGHSRDTSQAGRRHRLY